jgi:hypothetical protein
VRKSELKEYGFRAGVLLSHVGAAIGNHCADNQLGLVTASGTGYILSKNSDNSDTVRAPAVGFISAARVPEGGLPGFSLPLQDVF